MQTSRKFSLLSMLLAVVLCLSAITVAVVSADGGTEPPALQTTATFKTADATDGVITLTDMAPGIYTVAVKGADASGKQTNFGFYVDELGESFTCRTKAAGSFNSTDAFVDAFPAVLSEGTNTLYLFVANGEITEYKLTKVQDLPLAADNMSVHYAVNVLSTTDKRFVQLTCPKGGVDCDAKCTGVHYRLATGGYLNRWDAAGTCYYSLDELPADCFIRVLPDAESAGQSSNDSSFGFGYIKKPGGKTGHFFLRATTYVKMTVTAPKAGSYSVNAVGYTQPTAVKFNVNGADAETTIGQWVTTNTAFEASSETSAAAYGSFGTIDLKEGSNVVVMEVGENFAFGGLTFVHEHVYGKEYQKDATHHWSACACGAESEKIAHTGNANYENAAICTACGQEFGAALKKEASFLTSAATDGKIVLTDMAPGVYLVSVKGDFPAKSVLGFTVAENTATYTGRTIDAPLESAAEFTEAFPAILTQGTNTLTIHGTVATEYKLVRIDTVDIPLNQENMTFNYNVAQTVSNKAYVKVDCAVPNHTGCSGSHYYRANGAYANSWTYIADGEAGKHYFLTIDDLPDCYIRDASGTSETAGTCSDSSLGIYYTSPGGGSLFVRAGIYIKMTVTAPKAGDYTLYSAFNAVAPAPKLMISVNGAEAVESATVTTDPAALFAPGSQQSASVYGELATVKLAEGENVLVINSIDAWLTLPQFIGVHKHNFAYETTETQHWAKCQDCAFETEKQNHGTPVDDHDCTTAAVCPDCDYELVAAKPAHTGGEATCTKKAECAECGKEYGNLKEHAGGTATCTAKAVCTACGASYGEMEPHTGGEATCTAKAKCTVCNTEYGSLKAHEFTVTDKDATDHWKKCANCDATDASTKTAHTGGTATCTAKAVCTDCGASYGELAAHEFTAYKQLEDGHVKKCAKCDATDDATKAAHEYGEDKKCVCGVEKTGCGASIATSAIALTAVLGLGIGFIRKKKED